MVQPFVCWGAQAAPHMKLDMQEMNADFYSFSGQKCLTNRYWHYLQRELLQKMEPIEFGMTWLILVLKGDANMADLPTKFEAWYSINCHN